MRNFLIINTDKKSNIQPITFNSLYKEKEGCRLQVVSCSTWERCQSVSYKRVLRNIGNSFTKGW